MTDFRAFDARGYRTVDVRSGYAEWVATYEQTVEDAMDIHLLEALGEVPWETIRRAADLGCGTGRTGAWLRERGIAAIDGVPRDLAQDLEEMDVHRVLDGLLVSAHPLAVAAAHVDRPVAARVEGLEIRHTY